MIVVVSLAHIIDIFRDGGVWNLLQRLKYRFTSPSYGQWSPPNIDEDTDVVLTNTPLISIILPVCGPTSNWLIKAIQSIINQRYRHWQTLHSG